MGEKNYLVLLGEGTSDRYRLVCATEKGWVVLFCVQYEIFLNGGWHAVIRYDTAHGYPHCDMIHPDGSEDKKEYPNRSNAEVLTLGQEDIKRNWQKHRALRTGDEKMNELFAIKYDELLAEFNRYVTEHPEFLSNVPNEALIIFVDPADPEFSRYNLARVAEYRKHDDLPNRPVVYLDVGELAPLRSRMVHPRVLMQLPDLAVA